MEKWLGLLWLEKLSRLRGMKLLISAHFSAPVRFNQEDCKNLKNSINLSNWSESKGNFTFLDSLDNKLLKMKIIPKDPLNIFKD